MRISIVLAFALCILATCSVSASQLTLVKDGKSSYKIVLPKGSLPSEQRAAGELQEFIRQISGAELPVVPIKDGPSILLGAKAAPSGVDLSDLGDEGYVIRTVGRDFVIAGTGRRGTMYGVYGFLEDRLGCRWYSPRVSKIPKKSTIVIEDLNIRELPAFEYRDPCFYAAQEKDYCARNRINGSANGLDQSTGGKVLWGNWCHTAVTLIPSGEEKPEYFALRDGKRTNGWVQLCYSNPELVQIAARTVLRWIKENPEAKIFSVSQMDNFESCQCEKCLAIDKEEGSPSGTVLRFVNAVGAEVAKTHPEIILDTIAYQWTENPCKITKPAANVRVRLCPAYACQMHPYEKCPNNKGVISNLAGWSNITHNLYIWHYNTAFWHFTLPFPDLEELAADIDMYHRYGVKGIYFEGDYLPDGAGEAAELRSWLIAKLCWNPKRDYNELMDDFITGYYGKAAPYMRQYYDYLHKEVREKNIHMGMDATPLAPLYSPEMISKSKSLFALAEKAVTGDPDILARVRKQKLGIDYLEFMQPILRNKTEGRERELKKQLDMWYARCKEHGIIWAHFDIDLDSFYLRTKAGLGY